MCLYQYEENLNALGVLAKQRPHAELTVGLFQVCLQLCICDNVVTVPVYFVFYNEQLYSSIIISLACLYNSGTDGAIASKFSGLHG